LIRVSFVIGSLAIGGAETQMIRLVNGLDRKRFEPSVICLIEGGELEDGLAPDVAVIKPRGSPIAKGTMLRSVRVGLRALWVLAGSLRRRPDVVHAYLPAAYVPASLVAWCFRVRLIVAGRRGFTSSGVYRTFWWRSLLRLANRAIDVQVCNSSSVRDAAVANENLMLERTRVIHNGIDLPALNSPLLPPELDTEHPRAVMVANFIAYKGHVEVMRAVAEVVKLHPELHLMLIGDGPRRQELERLRADLNLKDNVVFAGRRKDAAMLVQAFDFSILGSSEESFPNALMESMAAGVPFVSTNVGGVTELVDDGVHGKLVPYGDVDVMADAITWMLEHPEDRRRLGEAGRRRIGESFSTERMVAETEKVYDELLSAGHETPAAK